MLQVLLYLMTQVITSAKALEDDNEEELKLDEERSEALDPLGAVRSPIKTAAEMSTPW